MGDDSYVVYERWQIDTAEYRERLLALAEASLGYAGAELRHETQELVVFAVGGPSAATAALIGEAPSNIHVTWQEAPYTIAELTDEVRRLIHQQPTRLTSAGPRHGGTGIRVRITDPELLHADDPTGMLGARYPVTVEYGEPPVTA